MREGRGTGRMLAGEGELQVLHKGDKGSLQLAVVCGPHPAPLHTSLT